MSHVLTYLKKALPFLAPLITAIEKDIAEQDAEFERRAAEARARHEQMREEARARRGDLLGGSSRSIREAQRRDVETLRRDWDAVVPPRFSRDDPQQ